MGNHDKDILEYVVNGEPFLADCFIGVPGKDSKPFLQPRVRAKVPSLVLEHFDPFDSASDKKQYIVFGTNEETYMEHRFTLYPDFQQVRCISLFTQEKSSLCEGTGFGKGGRQSHMDRRLLVD